LKTNISKIIFLVFIFFNINLVQANSIKLGLGSCLDQDYPQPIWESIKKENLNYFIFLGDNVYGDSYFGNLRKMKKAYEKQEKVLPNFLNQLQIYAIWDDHDFGVNDGGENYKNKVKAKRMFLDFWGVPKEDERNFREGVYFSTDEIFHEKKFKLIFLDTRYFRSELMGNKGDYIANKSEGATILGNEQWRWLKNQLNTEFDFLIIFSSIQIIATEHGYEKWSNFPNDREKLFDMLEQYKDKTLLFSGDRHRSGIYKKNGITEITSSSLNKPGSPFIETDTYLIGETYPEVNYSILEIFPDSLDVQIKNKSGTILNSIKIKL
jgi:alkaline phosphatase D